MPNAITLQNGRLVVPDDPIMGESLNQCLELEGYKVETAVNGREIWETWYTTRWLLEHGVVDLRPLITAELPLESFEEAFALLESGEACKIVLRPNGVTP